MNAVFNHKDAIFYDLQAKHYGFKKVVTVEDFTHHHPTQYPFHHYEHKYVGVYPSLVMNHSTLAERWAYQLAITRQAPFHDEPVEAIVIMHDPVDWAPEIQVAIDVLIGGVWLLGLLAGYHGILF